LLAHWLPLHGDAPEWSIEANPLDVTQEKLELWSSFGIRRISLGGQSFDAKKLKVLERDHSPSQLQHAIELAQQFMTSVSLDLIFAAPGETLDVWRQDIETAIACKVDHLSTYGLTYEKGARFWGLRSRNQLPVVTEETELEMYAFAIDTLPAAGLEHYEISNFARQGHECRHNQTYWNGEAWWAFGPSAARYVGDVRSVNHRSTLTYLRRMEDASSPVDEREPLTASQKVRERFVFGMRQIAGVDWKRLAEQADEATRDSISVSISEHTQAGWMHVDAGRVQLTRQGLFLSDSLWHHYL
jgi:oxygen-independent coproporphyrinogen-3 oxidase